MLGHYLLFNRDCAEALRTYERAFGAKASEMQLYGQMPPNPNFPIAEADKDLVLHARLPLGGMEIMCADSKERSAAGENMYVTVTTPDEALVLKAWAVLSEGGQVFMPLTPSFFAKQHGSLRDQHGINWMFTVSK